ncbi:hypothetical protein CYMTET_16805 [Cymbomonas tetramitiformis]|uniref:Uncharacterized protein n=1 Tax=Cymbomonas tetramitiformis TaxID=36881 RepID=A0AAE0L7W9_9CHLO|nr:hypothetical protein CYMTET_16805 [Cymbomonas tetramitiformis]
MTIEMVVVVLVPVPVIPLLAPKLGRWWMQPVLTAVPVEPAKELKTQTAIPATGARGTPATQIAAQKKLIPVAMVLMAQLLVKSPLLLIFQL